MIKGPTVKIIQTSKNRWHIEAQNGTILVDDLTLSSEREAEKYVNNYISSFNTAWSYEVIPLEDE